VIEDRIMYLLETENDFRATISSLVEGQDVCIEIDEQMAYKMFVTEDFLPIHTDGCTRPADMSMPELWTLIYYAGYLTQVVIALVAPSLRSSLLHAA
jgi:hypothetical protein